MKKNKIVSIVIVISLILLLFILLLIERKNYQEKQGQKSRLSLVTDASIFFTVDECANRYISYISDNNSKNLMSIINKDYARDYNLNINNIISKIDTYNFKDNIITFKTKKMYQEVISDSVTKYYLQGIIYKDKIDDAQKIANYYLIITIDGDTLIFDVTPYDGRVFKEKK